MGRDQAVVTSCNYFIFVRNQHAIFSHIFSFLHTDMYLEEKGKEAEQTNQ